MWRNGLCFEENGILDFSSSYYVYSDVSYTFCRIGHESFDLLHHDVVNPLLIEVDQIYHLASPASPKYYMYNPVKTIKTNTIGTLSMLGLAKRTKATILLASTSEIYGGETAPEYITTYVYVHTYIALHLLDITIFSFIFHHD